MPACGSCPRAASADGWSARRRWGFLGGVQVELGEAHRRLRITAETSILPARPGRGIGRAAPCTRSAGRWPATSEATAEATAGHAAHTPNRTHPAFDSFLRAVGGQIRFPQENGSDPGFIEIRQISSTHGVDLLATGNLSGWAGRTRRKPIHGARWRHPWRQRSCQPTPPRPTHRKPEAGCCPCCCLCGCRAARPADTLIVPGSKP